MIIPLLLITASKQNSLSSVQAEDRIVSVYRFLLKRPRSNARIPKSTELGKLLEHLENSGQKDALKDPYLFVALRAIRAEWGVPASSFTKEVDERIKGRFPAPVRKYWSPETRRIWMQAFYVPEQRPIGDVRKEIAGLKKDGVNSEPLEALSMFDGVLKPQMTHSALIKAVRDSVKDLLALSERNLNDIAAVSRAIGLIDLVVTDEIVRKEPLGEQDILDRIFALESRTIRNLNRLLNDDKPNFASFDMLRQHIADAKANR